jgi:hypothetical protein
MAGMCLYPGLINRIDELPAGPLISIVQTAPQTE